MRMSTIGLRGLLASTICFAMLIGCGAQEKGGYEVTGLNGQPEPTQASESGTEAQPIASEEAPSLVETPEDNGYLTEITVYDADADLLELTERKQTIAHEDDAELIRETIGALQSETDGDSVPLWKDIRFLNIELDNNLVSLDIAIPDEARLGAPGELLLVKSLKSVLFQFPFVDAIELKVEGETVESLMGHVEIDHPITRDSSS